MSCLLPSVTRGRLSMQPAPEMESFCGSEMDTRHQGSGGGVKTRKQDRENKRLNYTELHIDVGISSNDLCAVNRPSKL